MTRLVIFHINTELEFRGGEIQTLHLLRGLQTRGHRNVLVARPDSKILQQARSEGMEFFALPMRGEWDLSSGRSLRRHFASEHANILHAHTAHACSIALIARWPDRSPPVVFSRRVNFPGNRLFLRRKVKQVDAVIAVSNSIRNGMIEAGIPGDRIFVAESGTEFSVFDAAPSRTTSREELKIPENAFVIGNVAHFDKEKGQDTLIRVFSEFIKDHPNAFLLLVGDGPQRSQCEILAQTLHCRERVVFTLFRRDVERLYPAMDLYFLSSRSGEGWSGALREAMACGIPVIAHRQPSMEEQVQSGILVSSNPAEWRDAIEKLVADPDLRFRMAERAKQHARSFTVDSMINKTEDCYRAVLKKS